MLHTPPPPVDHLETRLVRSLQHHAGTLCPDVFRSAMHQLVDSANQYVDRPVNEWRDQIRRTLRDYQGLTCDAWATPMSDDELERLTNVAEKKLEQVRRILRRTREWQTTPSPWFG